MAISTQDQITRELARLRIWCDVVKDDESARERETEAAHKRIDVLLDKLDVENSKVAIPYA
jgi:hypothetical protein